MTAIYQPKSSLAVADLPSPFYVAHRGGSNVYPENTLEAFRAVMDCNHTVVEGGDCYLLTDGALGVMHDSTIDRTTSGSGNCADHSSASWKNLTVDASSWFGYGWKDTSPPLFEDVLREVRGRAIIFPEVKNTGSGAAIVSALQRHFLTQSAVVQSFTDSELTSARNAGIPSMLNTSGANPLNTTQLAALKTAGTNYVSGDTSMGQTFITNAINAGLTVVCYTPVRRTDRDTFLGYGVSGFFTDEPLYLSRSTAMATTDAFKSNTLHHGMLADLSTTRGTFVSGRLQMADVVSQQFVLIGYMCPVANASGTWRMTGSITYDQLTNNASDTTRWPGIAFCCTTDAVFDNATTGSGYTVIFRENGQVVLSKVTNGSATSLATRNLAAVSGSQTITFQIDVTPSSVTVTRTDVGTPNTVTSNDTTYRGGYFHLGKNDQSKGGKYSFSGLTVS